MTSGDWISNALRALADYDRLREAPEEVETRLLAAFRHRRARRKLKAVMLASLAAAAGLTVLFLARPHERRKPVAPAIGITQLVAAAPAPVPVEVAAAPAPKPVRLVRPVARQTREVVTEFFPLLDVALPFERGELLRVTVPMATMRRVGLPVNEDRLGDRVYADVLVGEEGLARAIRFVSYEQ
jgi:hypothetical protein